jgi:hypothetical protein
MKPIHTMMKKPKPIGLIHFYKWARKIGHYPAYEAVRRYWRSQS